MKTLKLGTRGSALALKQAEMTEVALGRAFPELEVERLIIKTTG
ncbi:hydroxymethylbilane synthase, partial [Akkermansiaceae bacterium]|nr:hydroxymethylbilane synthase [Akkermansiaceae bacterium]